MNNVRNWKWKAVNKDGQVIKGIWELADIVQVQKELRKQELYLLDIKIKRQSKLKGILSAANSKERWSRLARHLSLLLNAGIPLLAALEILLMREPNHLYHSQESYQYLIERIKGGADLSEAIAASNPPADPFFQLMVKTGERSGTLTQTLTEAALTMEREVYYKNKIQAALFYPLILMFGALLTIVILGLWVLPTYQNLFSNINGELPLLTQLILSSGRFLPLIFIILLILVILGLLIGSVSNRFRAKIIVNLPQLPLLGQLYKLGDAEKFSRVLGCLLTAGVPILEALSLFQKSRNNVRLQNLADDTVFAITQGWRIAPVIKASGTFSPDICEMIRIGEESGKLDEVLELVNRWSKSELEVYLERFSRMVEPFLITVMAGLIGLLAVGVLLPILQASSNIR